jgi:Na+-translocating ferredoxin:NAD+ oxidoreductase RnfE subunit
MKNKIIRFSIVTAACLVVWAVTTFVHFKNPKIPNFLQGFSMGMGIVACVALVYNIVIALKQKDNNTTVD